MNFIIGNAFMLLAATIMVSLGFVKDKNKIIIFQTIQIMLLAIGDLLLEFKAVKPLASAMGI